MGLNPDELLLTGIWSDGVPFNSDRSQTLETISLNIFGDDSARLPLTAFPKEFLHKKKTFECIFEVLQWSYKILLGGVFPSCRHDGQPFTNSDSYRRKLAHKSIGIWSPQNLISRKHATVRGAAAWPIDVAAHIAWLGSTQALKIHTLMATCYF